MSKPPILFWKSFFWATMIGSTLGLVYMLNFIFVLDTQHPLIFIILSYPIAVMAGIYTFLSLIKLQSKGGRR